MYRTATNRKFAVKSAEILMKSPETFDGDL